MKNSTVGIVLVLIAALLVSCTWDDISGSGVLTTENRELNAFIAVSVDGIANVNIVQGNAQNVKIMRSSFFNLSGQQIAQPNKYGAYIRKDFYENGLIKSHKIIIPNSN